MTWNEYKGPTFLTHTFSIHIATTTTHPPEQNRKIREKIQPKIKKYLQQTMKKMIIRWVVETSNSQAHQCPAKPLLPTHTAR